jgi:hypothetical protein
MPVPTMDIVYGIDLSCLYGEVTWPEKILAVSVGPLFEGGSRVLVPFDGHRACRKLIKGAFSS